MPDNGELFKDGDNQPTPTETQSQVPQEQPQPSQEAKVESGEPQESRETKPVLVYGDRVFSSEEEVVKKMVNADAFIEQLKEENGALRSEVETLTSTVSELKGKLETMFSQQEQTVTQPAQPQVQADTPAAVQPQDIEQLVNRAIEQKQQETVLQKNIRESEEAFVSKYGDKAKEVLTAKVSELGLTLDHVQQLAATSPSAFKKLMLGEDKTPNVSSFGTTATANSSAVTTNQPEVQSKLYKLKGKDLQKAMAERAKKIAEEKGIPLSF